MYKKIIYSNLEDGDILNNFFEREKLLIINSSNEILLAFLTNNYQLPGGHLEKGETEEIALKRELLEETGMDIDVSKAKHYLTIEYLAKDYPEKGLNTSYKANYYYLKSDQKPNLDKVNFTEEEKQGNFKLEYINKDVVVEKLTESYKYCTRKKVVRDTIDAIKSYMEVVEEM